MIMEEIKVGDIVNVVNWSHMYSTNAPWFEENFGELNRDWIIRFAFGDSSNYLKYGSEPLDKTEYTVLFIGEHNMSNKPVALIAEGHSYSSVYLIALDALTSKKLSPKKMTKAEIETELGYEIDIVEEDY